MPVDVNIPQIGESITTVFIARWIVQPGGYVAAGEPILEVDSDKASMEIPAPASGTLVETLAERCAEIVVGEFGVPWLRLRASKPGAVRGSANVGVIIERSRE